MNRAATPSKPARTITLVERVKAGEASAWEQFSKLYGPLVYRWARRSGLEGDDAAVVMQEVFRGIAVEVKRFSKTEPSDSLRGWLFSSTRNAVRQFRSRKQADAAGNADAPFQQVRDLTDDEIEDDSFNTDASLIHRSLHLIRNEFQDRTWRAFWRSVVEGQAAAAIAQQLGIKPRAVLQAKYRVLCRLREMVADE